MILQGNATVLSILFSKDAFQLYYDIFQVNWSVQIQQYLHKS